MEIFFRQSGGNAKKSEMKRTNFHMLLNFWLSFSQALITRVTAVLFLFCQIFFLWNKAKIVNNHDSEIATETISTQTNPGNSFQVHDYWSISKNNHSASLQSVIIRSISLRMSGQQIRVHKRKEKVRYQSLNSRHEPHPLLAQEFLLVPSASIWIFYAVHRRCEGCAGKLLNYC